MSQTYVRRPIVTRVWDTIFLDQRDADLSREKIQVVLRYGRATARVMHLQEDGHLALRGLHRIVAERHIRQPSPLHTIVEAKNGNRLDCRSANLEWRLPQDTNYKRQVVMGAPEGVKPMRAVRKRARG